MEFYDVLKKRHSVRQFEDKQVEKAKLDKIAVAAISAPSAGNLQAYRICLIRSQEKKDELVPAADYQEFLAGAGALLVFCADLRRSESKYSQRGFELYAIQDATIACAYAQLAATEEGLASVWVGDLDPLETSRVLSLNAFELPVSILAIGYPAGPAEANERRPLKEIVREF
ncbi:MAG: nitroreductase family protein [Candidatus Micrarchaeota archaeon]